MGEANGFRENVVLAKMTAKFRREAYPGEQLTYTATLVDLGATGGRVSGRVTSGDDLVAEADILFAHVGPDQLPPGVTDTKFVFTGELEALLKTAEAVATTPATTVG